MLASKDLIKNFFSIGHVYNRLVFFNQKMREFLTVEKI